MRCPKISVIIIGYRSAKNLPSLISSLKNQTTDSKIYEIIFVDDGSNDSSVKIWNLVQFNCKTLLIHHETNRGRSAARNSGIAQANGEYCLFTNANIVLPMDWIQRYFDFITKNPKTISACGLIKYTSSDKKFEQYLNRKSRGLHRLQNGDIVQPENVLFANAIIRRDYLNNLGGFDINFCSYGGEELDLMFRLSNKKVAVQFCENVSVLRKNHPGFSKHCERMEDLGQFSLPLLFKKHELYFQGKKKILQVMQIQPLHFVVQMLYTIGKKFYWVLPTLCIKLLLKTALIVGGLNKPMVNKKKLAI